MKENELKQQVKQLKGDCKSFNQDVQKLTEEIRILKRSNMNQKLNVIDKLDLSIIKHEQDLKSAYSELKNENLTPGESRKIHVEIEKLTFSIETLKFIKS